MTITAHITKTTNFAFDVAIKRGNVTLGNKRVAKPTSVAAAGWMERGQAKTAEEAKAVALKWAGY